MVVSGLSISAKLPPYRRIERPFYAAASKVIRRQFVAGEGEAVLIRRVLMAAAMVTAALQGAGAQFGGMPGMPGSGGGLGPPQQRPQQRPAQCQALLTIRDELQKRGAAIEAANQKRADVKVACGLFRNYVATEAKMLKMLIEDGPSCGVPGEIVQQVKGNHAKAVQTAQQVCDAAGRRRHDVPPGPDDDELRPFKLHPDPRPEPGRRYETSSD